MPQQKSKQVIESDQESIVIDESAFTSESSAEEISDVVVEDTWRPSITYYN